MTFFSTLRFFKTFLSSLVGPLGLAIAGMMSCFSASALNAQAQDDLFRGTWQINTPENGSIVMMVKSQNRASYFWGDNADRTVYQGTWSTDGESATLTWEDRSRHTITRDNLGFSISFADANGNERYTVSAQQVPTEILGQWAKPPNRETKDTSDRDEAKGFFGIWEIAGGEEYVFVESDRSAASTSGSETGMRGSWAKQGSELHIAWDSGNYSIIRADRRQFTYKEIPAGVIIEDDETEPRPAVRTIKENVPQAWLSDYEAEREQFTGGVAFSSRKVARDFYRGSWIVKLSDKRFERVDIARFGGLTTSKDRTLRGDWRMQGQDLFFRWDDGMREILSPIGRGFVLYKYNPGRPLDGVPTQIFAAAPADSTKLATHLAGREDVSEQMRSIAEAAGLDPDRKDEAGWGRTFARWAWPFGEDEAALSSDAILQEEFEGAKDTDPWWWPFWSEKQPSAEDKTTGEPTTELEAEAKTSEVTPATVSEGASVNSAPTPESEAPQKENEKKKTSARDWAWPF